VSEIARVEKPWGYELHWAKTERYVGKLIHVNAGHALSLQYHNVKDETIYLHSGRLLFEIDEGGGLEQREMKPGERLVIYHTGDEKSAVGTASVVAVDASDPRNPQVKIKVGKAIAKPKTLADIKARAAFAESPLVRQGRLSVVPLTAAQFAWLAGE